MVRSWGVRILKENTVFRVTFVIVKSMQITSVLVLQLHCNFRMNGFTWEMFIHLLQGGQLPWLPFCFLSNESAYDTTYNKTCATSKYSDKPVHPHRKARVLVFLLLITRRLLKAHAISEASDQTAPMRRLIGVFDARTSLIVGFVVHWLRLEL